VAAASLTPAVQVTAQDGSGNTATGFTGNITVAIGTNPSTGTLAGTLTHAAVGGVATFSGLSIDKVGTGYTLTATGAGTATSTAFDITAGTATQLVFSVQPSTTTAGAAITPAIQVTAQDANANTATGFSGNVTVTIGTNPSAGTLAGTLTHAAVGGVATFSGLSIDKVGTGYTLTATGAGTATSTAFDITAGTATALVFSVQPTNTVAGAAITPAVQVTAQDGSGNTATGFTGNITVAIGTNPGGGTLSGTAAVAASAGVATFSGLSIDKAGTGYTLTATGAGTATSTAFNITAAAATKMAIQAGDQQQAPVGTAVPIAPAVILRDQFDNTVDGVAVTFAVVLNNGVVNPTTPITTGGDGIAAVTSWTLGTVVGLNSLTATAAGTGIIPNPVTFTATGTPAGPSASRSSMTASPTPITASNGGSVSTITVTVRDEFDNLVSGATVTLASVDPGINITQPSSTTGTNGQVTGTMSATVAGTKTVTGTVDGTMPINQAATVTVGPGAASKLAFTGQPSDATTDAAIAPPVVVAAQDEFGNTATAFTGAIRLSITPGTGTFSARLDGTNPTDAIGGVATFPDLRINLPSILPPYQLDAASSPLTRATSSSFGVSGAPLP
jgi:Invasin, domain 3